MLKICGYAVSVALIVSAASGQPLSEDALRYATYQGIYETPVQLQDGLYAGEPYSPDSPARPLVVLDEQLIVRGDLDGDGEDEAAVLLDESGGGTGHFIYLAVVDTQDGEAVNVATTELGDRIPVRSMTIVEGQLVLELLTEGPGDAACCKYQKTTRVFALEGGDLALLSETSDGRLGLADLEGTTWHLQALNDGEPLPAGYSATAVFEGGMVRGSSFCNRYQAPYAQAEGETGLTIGPVFSTRMACPPLQLALEQEFFAKLEGVANFYFRSGRMALDYSVDDLYGSLFFTESAASQRMLEVTGAEVILGRTWQLQEIQYMNDTVSTPDDPGRYALTLTDEGTFSAQLDCNHAQGNYTLDGASLSFGAMAVTMALCPAGSLADDYEQGLNDAHSYVLENGELFISFGPDAGILHFSPAAEASGAVIEATFVCPDGTPLYAVFDNSADTVALTLAEGNFTLSRSLSGSGARYSDGDLVFWNRGDEALVERAGETLYEGCKEE